MARLKRKKINKPFGEFKLQESYTSLILGAIVVLVIGILFIIFAKGNRTIQTSSTNEGPSTENQMAQDKSNTSSTYTIKPGDDLWSISEIVYNDSYRWVELANANKIENPGLIHVGNKLTIPTVLQKETTALKPELSPKAIGKAVENSSIVGNTYTIKSGDNLWDLCVRAYGDGYRWVEIAKVNNIQNPDLIYPGNVLDLPR